MSASPSSGDAASSLIILLADGVRADTMTAALDAGLIPALERLRAEGGQFTVSSVFPSVTGPAYVPFLLGRHPAEVGLPGIRWFDRTRRTGSRIGSARSYVGPEMGRIDGDLDPTAPTMFELAPPAIGALAMINRGLSPHGRLGRGVYFAATAAIAHLRGRAAAWIEIDRKIAKEAVRRVGDERPRFAFLAFTGADKSSHAVGHDAAATLEALRVVDDAAARIRADAERTGRWSRMHLWVASDHGHSPVDAHDDLATLIRSLGHRVLAHPMVLIRRPDVAVMVSGNAMAHLYLEPARRTRPWWPALRGRWEALAEALLERPSVDLLLLPLDSGRTEVRGRGRGSAIVEREGGRVAYRPVSGDPLALGRLQPLDDAAAWEATLACDYPDALVQIASLAAGAQSGDIILSAARGWDFRGHFEPIPHVSAHGALHREHMLVPLILNRRPVRVPRRTVEVMASGLTVLGIRVPSDISAESFF